MNEKRNNKSESSKSSESAKLSEVDPIFNSRPEFEQFLPRRYLTPQAEISSGAVELSNQIAISEAASSALDLSAEFTALEIECRGSGNLSACKKREELVRKLRKLGYCHGKVNEASYQYSWHLCTKNSIGY